jgi:hypothetical protein
MGAVGVSRLDASANHWSEKARILPPSAAETRSKFRAGKLGSKEIPGAAGNEASLSLTDAAGLEGAVNVIGCDLGCGDALQLVA